MSSRRALARVVLPSVYAGARIFGNRVPDGTVHRTGHKLLRQKLKGPKLASWYLEEMENKFLYGYMAEARITQKATLQRMARKGKTTTKKGAGRKAMKGKR